MFIYTIRKKNLDLNNEHLSEQMMSEKEDGDEEALLVFIFEGVRDAFDPRKTFR